MTPIEALQAGDRDGAMAALAALSATERRKYAPQIIKLYKGWNRHDFTISWTPENGTHGQREAALACVIAVATASELARDNNLPWLNSPEVVVEAAQTVPPPWLNADDLEVLAGAGKINWATVEGLVAAGLCERPTSDRLIESMVEGIGFRSDEPLVELLRKAPGLIDQGVLYRVFEVEGGQQSSLCAADKYRREENQWATALAELSETGELDRGRLLDGSLDALARDFAAFRAGWFSRFHDRLAPTDDERAARAAAYLRLLGSTIPATVSFAVKNIAILGKQERVDAEDLLRAIPPALQAKQKGTVKKAAKLLQAAAKSVPSAVPEAIATAIDALVHPEVDVQKTLLDVIDKLMPAAGADQERLTAQLAGCADLVAASLRSRLPTTDEAAPATEPTVAAPTACVGPFDDSLRVSHATTVEDALDKVASALEHEDDPIAQEVAFDAIARFSVPPDNWATLASPVRKRAQSIWKRDSSVGHPVQLVLAYAALAWTRGEKTGWESIYGEGKWHDFEIYLARTHRLVDRVLKRTALPLLSTPTHRSGFIDPGVFHERLQAWQSSGDDLDPHDTVIALMRLPTKAVEKARGALNLKLKKFLDLASKPPTYRYEFSTSSRTSGNYTFHSVHAEPTKPIPEPKRCLALRHALLRGEVLGDVPMTRWAATVTPSDLQWHFARGVRHLGEYNMDDPLATGLSLEAARDPWVDLGEAGHWLLMLCLAARGARANEVAVDVVIDGVDQGRVAAGALGHVLGQLMPSGVLKAKRVTTTLGQVAATSLHHAEFVIAVIAAGLRGEPEGAPRDLGSLLSLLYEQLVATGKRLEDDDARRWLEQQRRGGQVAKFRKSILSL